MKRAMRRSSARTMAVLRWLPMLALVVALMACGEARIVQRDDYVQGNAHRPPHRDAAPRPIAGRGEYVVVRGDTLYGVAFRNGMDFRELAAINGIESPYTIYLGQLLRLRGDHMRPAPRALVVSAHPEPVEGRTSAPPPPSVHDVRVEPLPDTRPAATATKVVPATRPLSPPKPPATAPSASATSASPPPVIPKVAIPPPAPVVIAPPPAASADTIPAPVNAVP